MLEWLPHHASHHIRWIGWVRRHLVESAGLVHHWCIPEHVQIFSLSVKKVIPHLFLRSKDRAKSTIKDLIFVFLLFTEIIEVEQFASQFPSIVLLFRFFSFLLSEAMLLYSWVKFSKIMLNSCGWLFLLHWRETWPHSLVSLVVHIHIYYEIGVVIDSVLWLFLSRVHECKHWTLLLSGRRVTRHLPLLSCHCHSWKKSKSTLLTIIYCLGSWDWELCWKLRGEALCYRWLCRRLLKRSRKCWLWLLRKWKPGWRWLCLLCWLWHSHIWEKRALLCYGSSSLLWLFINI